MVCCICDKAERCDKLCGTCITTLQESVKGKETGRCWSCSCPAGYAMYTGSFSLEHRQILCIPCFFSTLKQFTDAYAARKLCKKWGDYELDWVLGVLGDSVNTLEEENRSEEVSNTVG